MKPSIALSKNRSAVVAIAHRFPVSNPRVFGSVVRGDDHEDSDLDILVDTLPDTSLFDLGGLQLELEKLLGVPVDVRTPGDLHPKFRSAVLSEAKPL